MNNKAGRELSLFSLPTLPPPSPVLSSLLLAKLFTAPFSSHFFYPSLPRSIKATGLNAFQDAQRSFPIFPRPHYESQVPPWRPPGWTSLVEFSGCLQISRSNKFPTPGSSENKAQLPQLPPGKDNIDNISVQRSVFVHCSYSIISIFACSEGVTGMISAQCDDCSIFSREAMSCSGLQCLDCSEATRWGKKAIELAGNDGELPLMLLNHFWIFNFGHLSFSYLE